MSIRGKNGEDTRSKRIDPALVAAGWGKNCSTVRRKVIRLGRIQSGGTLGKGLYHEYVHIQEGQ